MNSTKLKKVIAIAALGAALSVGGAVSAQAVTTNTAFSSIVPKAQQSHYWASQTKTNSGDSYITFTSIGASYTMNVKAQNMANSVQYEEKKGLSVGGTTALKNGTPPGTGTREIVTNNTWAAVDVLVNGSFKTN